MADKQNLTLTSAAGYLDSVGVSLATVINNLTDDVHTAGANRDLAGYSLVNIGTLTSVYTTSLTQFPNRSPLNPDNYAMHYTNITQGGVGGSGHANVVQEIDITLGSSVVTGGYVALVVGATTGTAIADSATLLETINVLLALQTGYLGSGTAIEIDIANSTANAHRGNGVSVILGNSVNSGGTGLAVASNNAQLWQYGLAIDASEIGIVINVVPAATVGILMQGGSSPANGWLYIRPGDDLSPFSGVIGVYKTNGSDLVFGVDKAGDVTAAGLMILPGLPTSNPGATTKRLWADPSDGYRVKYAI